MAGRSMMRRNQVFSPVSWLQYFDEAHDICPNETLNENDQLQDTFRVYLRNFRPPFAPQRSFGTKISNPKQIEKKELEQYSKVPTLVTLHGGGYSGLTWALFTQCIEQECNCRILSIDLRSHGDTRTNDDERMDINTLVDDVIKVVHATHRICGFIETPELVLIGHSMGGAIAIKCSSKCSELLPSLAGFVIIDVVEGTAKDALPLMMSVIQTRPVRFSTLGNAIEWSFRSGMAKNPDAARVSMPGNLLNIESGHLGIHDIELGSEREQELSNIIDKHKFHIGLERLASSRNTISTSLNLSKRLPVLPRVSALRSARSLDAGGGGFPRPDLGQTGQLEELAEESTSGSSSGFDEKISHSSAPLNDSTDGEQLEQKKPAEIETTGYCWRTDLAKTQPFWNGWFDGLSDQLLNAPVRGKFLLLAGIDRLDKTLTIGQMQGKFMMKVLPKCGHAVHEDVPDQVASAIGQFLIRNKFATATEGASCTTAGNYFFK